LNWRLTQAISQEKQQALKKLIRYLMHFAMLLGGFGKSWRRADHHLFFDEYYRNKKPLIGCHWQWRDKSLDKSLITNSKQVASFLDKVRETAGYWLELEGFTSQPNNLADWREAWHQDNVQVWGRVAEDKEDSRAIYWFHGAYRPAIQEINQIEASIQSAIFGVINYFSRSIEPLHRVLGIFKVRQKWFY
jgi:CRISPR-associated protein Cmr6